MITREFDLMLYQEGNLLFINANQYDSGEQWIFTLYEENGVKYTPATGAIVGVKSDGKGIINTGTVDEYGRVVINETQQMTAAAGLATFELLIDNDTHGTANFKVDVEPRPSDNADLSDSDLSLIQEAVDAASEIEDLLGGQDVPTVITPIISDWLDDNITNPSNPPIDTSLTVSGAAADAKVTGVEITDLKSALNSKFVYGKNLINPDDISTGTLISAADGRTETNISYNSSGYIPVANGQSVTISPNCRKFLAFDSSKTAIQSTYINAGVSEAYTYTATVDGYIRISYLATNTTEQIEYGTEATAYEPYSIKIADGIDFSDEQKTYIADSIATVTEPLDTDVENIKESFEEEKSDKVVSTTVTKTDDNTGYINQNGAIDTSATGYFYSDFIPVIEGDLITSETVGGTATPLRYIASYDSNKAVDRTKGWNNSGQSFDAFVVPSGIAYIRATFYVSRQSTQILNITTVDGVSTYYAKTQYVPTLKDKKWVSCGDSFTQGYFSGLSDTEFKYQDGKYVGENKVYPFVIGLRTGAEIVNEAISGSTMAYVDGTHNEFSTANGRYTQIPSDADYITLYFGINDSHHQVPIGTIEDTGNTTFYGAWNTVMQYLITNHPNAKIGIIISNGCDTIDYPNAEIAIAKKYGVSYLDMNSDYKVPILFRVNGKPETDASIIQANYEHYRVSPTNGHPNVAMHEYESTIIQHWLESI